MQIGTLVALVAVLLLPPVAGQGSTLPNCDVGSYPLGPGGVREMKNANLAGCDLSGAMLEAADTGRFRFEPAGKRLPKGFDAPVTLLTLERP